MRQWKIGRKSGLELLHGRAELLSELPDLLSAVTPEQIAAAARSLDPGRCAILRIVPAAEAN